MIHDFTIGVFTKPWPAASPQYLAERLHPLGVDAVELAVRDGFAINPQNCAAELPKAAECFGNYRMHIHAVAPDISRFVDRNVIEACHDAGVQYIRIMQRIDMQKGYHRSYAEALEYYTGLADFLLRKNVKIAFQNHAWGGHWICSPAAIDGFVRALPEGAFCSVFEPAHCIMSEPLDIGIDIMRQHMAWVSLKSGYFRRLDQDKAFSSPEAPGGSPLGHTLGHNEPQWEHIWTTHEEGRFSWYECLALLKNYGYTRGFMNFFAQYTDTSSRISGKMLENDAVLPYLQKDIERFQQIAGELFSSDSDTIGDKV